MLGTKEALFQVLGVTEETFAYLGDTLDEVLDVRAHGPHGSQLFPLAEPLLNLDALGCWHRDVKSQMLETLGQGATGALHYDDTGLDRDINAIWHDNQLICVNLSHPSEEIKFLKVKK